MALAHTRDVLYTWGSGRDAQLGHSLHLPRANPRAVSVGGEVCAVGVGYAHVVVIVEGERGRRVVTWGTDGICLTRPQDMRVVPRLPAEDIVQVVCGKSFSVYRSCGGVVYVSGLGDNGRLGVGDTHGRARAVVVDGLLGRKIVNVAAGSAFAIAVCEEGEFFTWGSGRNSAVRVRGWDADLRFPLAGRVEMDACASGALLAGVDVGVVDVCFSGVRCMRGFVDEFVDGCLPRIERTKVFYMCVAHGKGVGCDMCYVRAYGKLVVAACVGLREMAEETGYERIDWSMYSEACVKTVVRLVCSGVIDEAADVATMQDVSALLCRVGARKFDGIVTEFLRRRLLRGVGTRERDMWDCYDSHTEGADERRMRTLLGAVDSDGGVEICIRAGGSVVNVCKTDVMVLCAHSEKMRAIVEEGRAVGEKWTVDVGDGVVEGCVDVVRDWCNGGVLKAVDSRCCDAYVRLHADVLRVAHHLGMCVLKECTQRMLAVAADDTMTFSTWRYALRMSSDLQCERVQARLLSVGDAVCAEVEMGLEEKRVEAFVEKAKRYSYTWNIEIARSARRGLGTFRRSRVYCDGAMPVEEAIMNVETRLRCSGRVGEDGEGYMDGRKRERVANGVANGVANSGARSVFGRVRARLR